MRHELKIDPAYFNAVIAGDKTFEIRNNGDRGFQKGDTALLKEHYSGIGYSGKSQLVEITYVCNYNQPLNQVVFAMRLINEDDNPTAPALPK